MKLWAVTMVKDELDILPYTLGHLVTQGLTGLIVSDNMSTDGTWEMLQRYQPDCDYTLKRDFTVGYYQSEKMTALAQEAFSYGAEAVIPFDADELWFDSAGRSLDVAVEQTRGHCLAATLYNHYPTSADNPDEVNPFLRIVHRDPTPAALPKVAVRFQDGLVIAQGNHDATANVPFTKVGSHLCIAHCPWRTYDQFEQKVRNGYQAYRATDLPAEAGAHWRGYGAILEGGGPEGLQDVFTQWFYDPDLTLERFVPPFGAP